MQRVREEMWGVGEEEQGFREEVQQGVVAFGEGRSCQLEQCFEVQNSGVVAIDRPAQVFTVL